MREERIFRLRDKRFSLLPHRPSCRSKIMAFLSGSPAPLRDVKLVQFGVLGPDELVSILLDRFQKVLNRVLLSFLF